MINILFNIDVMLILPHSKPQIKWCDILDKIFFLRSLYFLLYSKPFFKQNIAIMYNNYICMHKNGFDYIKMIQMWNVYFYRFYIYEALDIVLYIDICIILPYIDLCIIHYT